MEDNDGDGLVDCEDPECCWSEACGGSQYCSTVPDPASILLKAASPASPFAPFYERHKFLVEPDSLQKFAKMEEFEPRRVSVVRGRVLTPAGEGLRGVRVSPHPFTGAGFTLTRPDGWFDMLLNGGGPVTLRFGKSPFVYQSKSVFVPWNQIVIMDEVRLSRDLTTTRQPRVFCSAHSELVPRPRAAAVQDEGLKETVSLRPFRVNLVYRSRRARGHRTELLVEVVRHRPDTLETVHTRLEIQGRVFTEILEADDNLTHRFVFDGLDVYGRRVYGKALVKVAIGYQYKFCPDIVWETSMETIHTSVPHSSDIGGWDLDIHHRYSPEDGVVYKGDGTRIDLRQKEKIVVALNENFTRTVMGPTAVEVDREGTLYVGDSTFITRIDQSGRATNLLRLNESTSSARYFLALSSTGSHLYLSDPTMKRILKVPVTMDGHRTPDDNFEVVVGTGEMCTLMDSDSCGEGEAATAARLVYPKGLAVTLEDELVFVDGNRVRKVDRDGKVITVAGSRKMASEWKPSRCGSDIDIKEANLNWPTDIAINPVNDDIVLIDQGAVYQITREGRIVEKINIECNPGKFGDISVPTNVAFSPTGELVISDDRNMVHRLLGDGTMEEVAGSMSYCKRAAHGCLQSDFEETLTVASKARFQRISDVAVGPDGSIFVADLEKHHIREIKSLLPQFVQRARGKHRETFEVMSADTKEMYVFDKLGVHLETKGLFAAATGHNFLYQKGGLWMVHDKNMNHIEVMRSGGDVTGIDLSTGQSHQLRVNKQSDLQEVRAPTGFVTMFQYRADTGLLKTVSLDRGKMHFIYEYSPEGHLLLGLSPVQRLEKHCGSALRKERSDIATENALLLELYEAESKINPVTVGFTLAGREETSHSVQWEYFIHAQGRSSFGLSVDGIGKRFLVNDKMAFKSELHPRSMIQSLYDGTGDMLLKVERYAVPKRTLMIPRAPLHAVDQTFDENRRPKKWSWGSLERTLDYDQHGRIIGETDCEDNRVIYKYSYEDDTFPTVWVDQDGNEYEIGLDNSGGVERIGCPTGEVHSFGVMAHLGSYALDYRPPWSATPVQFKISDAGKVVEKRIKGTSVRILYHSDSNSSWARTAGLALSEERSVGTILQLSEDSVSGVTLSTNISWSGSLVEVRRTVDRGPLEVMDRAAVSCGQESGVQHVVVICNVTVNGAEDRLERRFDNTNNQLASFRGFEVVRSGQSSVYIHREKGVEFKQEFNGYNRPVRTVIKLAENVVYSSAIEYSCNQKISKISEQIFARHPRMTSYAYSPTGRLGTAVTPALGWAEWTYVYDANSNLVNADFQIGNTSFLYEFNTRISRAGYNKVTYNEGGGLASRSGYRFQYNGLDQLTHIYFGEQLRKEVVYDLVGRPVLVRDRATDEATSLLYALDSRPWLLTHCQADRLYSLTYNSIHQLMAIEDGKKMYMVITSPAGTPEIVFSEGGDSVKEVTMSPFGLVLQDSNEDFRTCVGYHGGVNLEETGIVIIEGRPYDSILGTWMVPDTDRMLALPKDPADVFLYRFKNNDPINAAGRPDVESLEGWLDLFDLGLGTLASPVLDPGRLASSLQPRAELKLTEQQEAQGDRERVAAVLDPSVQASLSFEEETRPQAVGRFFHIKSPLLGPNIILTISEDGTSTVIQTYTIEEANPFEKTLARLLNNTIKLENYGDQPDSIYFLAPAGFLPADVSSLKERMAVEERQVPPHGTEICFHTQESRLCGLAGLESLEVGALHPSD